METGKFLFKKNPIDEDELDDLENENLARYPEAVVQPQE